MTMPIQEPTPIGARAAFAARAATSHPLLAFPAQFVAELPNPVVLRLTVPGSPVEVCLWTGTLDEDLRASLPVLADTIIFDAPEIAALVCATEADRLWHADFLGLCFEKWRKPEVRVTTRELLGGANPDPTVSWSLERVLLRLGIQLDSVEFDTSPIARPLHAAA